MHMRNEQRFHYTEFRLVYMTRATLSPADTTRESTRIIHLFVQYRKSVYFLSVEHLLLLVGICRTEMLAKQ
jgi:hypothetical protein